MYIVGPQSRFKTKAGYPLGIWVERRRRNHYKKGELDLRSGSTALLEELGFSLGSKSKHDYQEGLRRT